MQQRERAEKSRMSICIEGDYSNGYQLVLLGPVSHVAKLVRHDGGIRLNPNVSANHSLVYDKVLARLDRTLRQF